MKPHGSAVRRRASAIGAGTAVAILALGASAADAATTSTTAAIEPPVPVTITTEPGETPAPGYFLVDPYQLKNSPVNGPEIVDNQGRVVFYEPLPAGYGASNLQVQTYRGQRVLTFWQGTTGNPAFGAISSIGIGQGEDVVLNSHYQVIATFKGADGLQPDAHEFTLTPDGDALITAYNAVPNQQLKAQIPDLTTLGFGNITVVDSHALVVDLATGQLVQNWSALDHVPLTAGYTAPQSPWDFFHINSISLDTSGNLLINARNTWATYDVSRQTGDINWQLGGKGSTFKLGPGVQFAWQHDPRFSSPTQISVFDDADGYPEGLHLMPAEPQSRAEWINLDFTDHTATLAKQILQPPGQAEAWSQGSVQDLTGGGTVVGWGSAGTFSEYSPSGALTLIGRLPSGPTISVSGIPVVNAWNSYRTYKTSWTGTPGRRPAVAVAAVGMNKWSVSAAWNGDTQVTHWRILAGSSPTRLGRVKTVAWTGLNTAIAVGGSRYRYLEVQALADGRVLPRGTSALIKLPAAG